MAMDLGSKGSLKADINVTPLVDVMLVLLIIMMLIAPILRAGVPLALPVTPDNLIPQVQRVLEDKKEKIVYLKGDKDAKYSAIMDAMDALRNGQIENIALITEKKNKPAGAGGAQ